MSTFSIVLIVITIILIAAIIVLYFLGKRAEKKQAEQQAQLEAKDHDPDVRRRHLPPRSCKERG